MVRNIKHTKVGRPTVISEQIIRVLEDCFKKGLSDKVACEQAKIGRTAFYEKLKSDEEFANKIYQAKNILTLKAAAVVSHALDAENVKVAQWLLERKDPEGFGAASQSVLINQTFVYEDPWWWTPPQDIIEAQEKEKEEALQKENRNTLPSL